MWAYLIVVAAVVITMAALQSYALRHRKNSALDGPEEIAAPVSSEGIPIPVVFGSVDISKPNTVWYGDTKTTSIKKDGQIIGYKYHSAFHFGLCEGHIDRMLEIKIGDKFLFINYDGAEDSMLDGSLPNVDRIFDKPSLFGGDDKEGGFWGILDLLIGLPGQSKNTYLVNRLGENIPAFRGYTSVIAHQCYIGTSVYLQPWKFRVQRIMKRFDGLEQWYPEKAIIPANRSNVIIDPLSDFDINIDDDAHLWAWTAEEPPLTGTNADFDASWEEYMIDKAVSWFNGRVLQSNPGAFGYNFTGDYEIGTSWPIVDSDTTLFAKKTFYSTGRVDLLFTGYAKHTCWIVLDDIKFLVSSSKYDGNYATNVVLGQGAFEFVVPSSDIPLGYHELKIIVSYDTDYYGSGGSNYFYLKAEEFSHNGMNPAHIIREVLTDPDWGMNYSEDAVNDDEFKSVADDLYDEGFSICTIWDRQSSAENFINEILRHINGQLYTDRTTGKFVPKLVRKDYLASLLPRYDKSDIESISNLKRPALNELINEVVVNYFDVTLNREACVSVQDIALVQTQGGVISKSFNYPSITNSEIATSIARRELQLLSSSMYTFSCKLKNSAKNINIADVFRIDYPDYDLNDVVVRATGINLGDGTNNKVSITCVQDVFVLPLDNYKIDGGLDWENPTGDATYVFARAVFEAPYYKLAHLKGASTVNALLASNPDLGYLMAAAGRPKSWAVNADMMVNPGAGYQLDTTVDFCPYAVLNENISKIETTFNVTNFIDYESVISGNLIQIDEELMLITSLSQNELTVKRGVYDSIVSEHNLGAYILVWDYFVNNPSTEYNDGDSLSVKLLTRTNNDILTLYEAPAISVEMNSRALRPYLPGNLKINNEYFPILVDCSSDVSVTWEHRNRLLMSATGFDETGITSEANVEYQIQVLESGNETNVLHSQTGITASYYNIPSSAFSGIENAILQLSSVRNSLESLYKYNHTFTVEAGMQPLIWINENSTIIDNSGSPPRVLYLTENSNSYEFQSGGTNFTPEIVENGLNSMRILRFNGTASLKYYDNNLQDGYTPFLNNVPEAWCMCLYKSSSTTPYACGIMSLPQVNAQQPAFERFGFTQSSWAGIVYNKPGVNGISQSTDGWSEKNAASEISADWHMVLVRIKYSNATGIINIDGNADDSSSMSGMSSSNTESVNSGYFYLGEVDPSLSSWLLSNGFIGSKTWTGFEGDIAEFMFGEGEMTQDYIDTLFGYLAHKWGLTANLPANHPYKTNPPNF